MGRFAQADSIVPSGVQGLDRYAYSNNSPLKYVDPSGHDPWWSDSSFYYADILHANTDTSNLKLGKPYVPELGGGNYLNTYIVAGLSTQNTNPNNMKALPTRPSGIVDLWNKLPNHDTGYGYANAHIDEIKVAGYSYDDRDKLSVAIGVMQKRISPVIDACNAISCTPTDDLIAASAAQNSNIATNGGFTALSIKDFSTHVYGNCAATGTCLSGTNLPWTKYYGSGGHDSSYNKTALKIFTSNVAVLQSQGWPVPDVNWNTIYSLINGK